MIEAADFASQLGERSGTAGSGPRPVCQSERRRHEQGLSQAARRSGASGLAGTRSAMRHADPAHRAAARMLGYALVTHEPEEWIAAAIVWRLRLPRSRRAALLIAALQSVDDEDLEPTLDFALGGAGEPLPWFISPLDEAATWAAFATDEERTSYALAAFNAMRPSDQRVFLEHVRGRAVA